MEACSPKAEKIFYWLPGEGETITKKKMHNAQ